MRHPIFREAFRWYLNDLFAYIERHGLKKVDFDFFAFRDAWIIGFLFSDWRYTIEYSAHSIHPFFYDEIRRLYRDMVYYFELIQ